MHMLKYAIAALIIIVLVGGGGYYYWQMQTAAAPEVVVPVDEQLPPTSTYATSTFSVTYPVAFAIDSNYAYEQFEGKPIFGVKFTVPESMATSTNLSSDTYVSVETLPRANACSGDIYLPADVRATSETYGGVTYSVASSSDAGAGNLYEEFVYALPDSQPCTAVRYFIHSTQLGNYPDGTVTAYDRAALIAAFDSIRRSVTLSGQATTTQTIRMDQ